MVGILSRFLLGWLIFRGELLVLGSVHQGHWDISKAAEIYHTYIIGIGIFGVSYLKPSVNSPWAVRSAYHKTKINLSSGKLFKGAHEASSYVIRDVHNTSTCLKKKTALQVTNVSTSSHLCSNLVKQTHRFQQLTLLPWNHPVLTSRICALECL